MVMYMSAALPDANQDQWLKRYYWGRAVFSIVWVALALGPGTKMTSVAAVLLLIYPAWDAAANWLDASASGGMARNRTQRINVWVSGLATLGVAVALTSGMSVVTGIIGIWAIASGLLQLGTAVLRRKTHGAQWSMILSGAQSALAGGFFISQSLMNTPPTIVTVAGYAGFGAFYFLVSGIWLTVGHSRRQKRAA